VNESPAILIVDDEPDLLDNIGLALEAENYTVLTAADGVEALAVLKRQPVQLILADIAMPNMNGYQLFERVRQNPAWITIPFIFLSARSLDSDVRYGKELGADDYLTKPIRAADLLAVVRGKLRRARQLVQTINHAEQAAAQNQRVLSAGELRIEPDQHRVWLNNTEVRLSAKEFALLEFLARQAGGVVSPQDLIEYTHGYTTDSIEAGSLLRPIIFSLRQKLNIPAGEAGYIDNVRGVGYRLVVPQ